MPASKLPTAYPSTTTPVSKPFVLYLPANCEHNCVNTHGSFKCTCRPGYALNAQNGTCHGKWLQQEQEQEQEQEQHTIITIVHLGI